MKNIDPSIEIQTSPKYMKHVNFFRTLQVCIIYFLRVQDLVFFRIIVFSFS